MVPVSPLRVPVKLVDRVNVSSSTFMRTYPQVDNTRGVTVAFDIENVYVGPSTVGRILSTVRHVSDVEVRPLFGRSPDVHVRFKYVGLPYVVWEPYGDNSTYWVGPEDIASAVDAAPLEEAFRCYDPPIHRRIFGDLLSLRFLKWKEHERDH